VIGRICLGLRKLVDMAEKTTWREELEDAVLDAIADLVDFLTSFLFWFLGADVLSI
jgi:hypothetical protein